MLYPVVLFGYSSASTALGESLGTNLEGIYYTTWSSACESWRRAYEKSNLELFIEPVENAPVLYHPLRPEVLWSFSEKANTCHHAGTFVGFFWARGFLCPSLTLLQVSFCPSEICWSYYWFLFPFLCIIISYFFLNSCTFLLKASCERQVMSVPERTVERGHPVGRFSWQISHLSYRIILMN